MMDGQQITFYLKYLNMIILAINNNLVLKVKISKYLKLKNLSTFLYFLYRTLHLKEISIVLKWPRPRIPL